MNRRLLLLLLVLLLPCASAFPAIARVQSISGNTSTATAASLVLTLGATPTAGNVIILAAATSNSSALQLAYGSNISWTAHVVVGPNSTASYLWIGRVFASASATITITSSQSVAIAAVAVEYSGANIIVDRGSENTGNSSTPSTGTSATTGTANEIWIGALSSRSTGTNTFSSPSNSFTIVDQSSSNTASAGTDRSVCFLEFVASSTGTASTSATASVGTSNFAGQTMTLREIPATVGSAASSHVWGN